MGLEDFEKALAAEKARSGGDRKRERSRSRDRKREHRDGEHGDSSRHHHRRHRHPNDGEHRSSRHREKRLRQSSHEDKDQRERRKTREQLEEPERSVDAADDHDDEEDDWVEKEADTAPPGEDTLDDSVDDPVAAQRKPDLQQRDNWMEAPSALDIDYVQRKRKQSPPPQHVKATEKDYQLKIHEKELNHQLKDLRQGEESEAIDRAAALEQPAQHDVKYTFGDPGASWRMTKLRAVYRQAEETKRKVEDVAIERFGDLRAFDDAREEEIELDRRERYGEGYVGKDKPSGDLYQERKLDAGLRREHTPQDEVSEDEFELAQGTVMKEKPAPATTIALDQTALNKLKAQMMKAKLRKAPDAAKIEAEYNAAVAGSVTNKHDGVVVLNKMESRVLDRGGEVTAITNKRGQERGLVKENEDMSIEDMVRQEKRSRHQVGGEGRAFAERIAKDSKFDNDLDYLDENASKLAASAPKSTINLRATAISDYQKTRRILDSCPLCTHEDTTPATPPLAPIVSLATRVFLTLPTSPEITPYGLCATIAPIQHRLNLLECDDDEWEEIRNFMKSLTRFYYSQKPRMGVIFYENAAHEGRKRHASLEAIPLPLKFAEQAPAFFKEAILAADEEWTQHRKVINTLANATEKGWGKSSFRRSLVSELPYFHVWFQLDGGMGHVVEDVRRWPRGDLFARELIGGMLDVGAEIVKRQGRWRRGDEEMRERVEKFRKGWAQWDWTKALLEAE